MYNRKRRAPNPDWEWKKRKVATAEGIQAYVNAQHNPAQMRGTAASKLAYGDTWRLASADQRNARMQAGFYGRGDYRQTFRNFGAQALRAGGRWAGAYLAGPSGGNWGHAAGAATSRWLGWGKYRKKSYRKNYRGRGDYGGDAGGNQIMAGSVETPMTVNQTDDLSGDIMITHREFLGNVTALGTGTTTPSAFNVVSYALNPGLLSTFPWLSQTAQNFTLYEPEGIIFEYVPTSGELGSVSNALGKIVMTTQYDPDAAPFTSTIQMENYDYSNTCKPSEHMVHGVETDPAKRATKELYVRTGPTAKDKVFTDIGLFQIATEGLPVNVTAGTIVNVGELWVSYKIRLSRAQLYGAIQNNNVATDYFIGSTPASPINNFEGELSASFVGSQIYAPAFKTTGLSQFQFCPKLTNNLGGSVTGGPLAGIITYTFPTNIVSGTFKFALVHVAASITGFAGKFPQEFSATNAVLHNGAFSGLNIGGSQLNAPSVATATGGQTVMTSFYVTVTAPGNLVATVVMNWNTGIPLEIHRTSLMVIEVPSNLLTN